MLSWDAFVMLDDLHIALPIESDGKLNQQLVLFLRDNAAIYAAVLQDCSLSLAFEC